VSAPRLTVILPSQVLSSIAPCATVEETMADDTAVREQMSRILGSPGFQNSERLSRFLRFAVEAKLRGEGEKIKEYLIGREVFDRNEDYDPRLDPIVRVEARRLLQKTRRVLRDVAY